MKFQHLIFAILTLGLFSLPAMAQDAKKDQDVTVFESVLATADWANFKYMDELKLAKKGDYDATLKLLKFCGTVDGKAALDHSVTLLELLSGQDVAFASALVIGKNPKLNTVILDRLQLAQGRTTKETLHQPIKDWAPITWDVLHGAAYTPPPTPEQMLMLEQMQMNAGNKPKTKPGAPATPSDKEDSTPASTTKKAQKGNKH